MLSWTWLKFGHFSEDGQSADPKANKEKIEQKCAEISHWREENCEVQKFEQKCQTWTPVYQACSDTLQVCWNLFDLFLLACALTDVIKEVRIRTRCRFGTSEYTMSF